MKQGYSPLRVEPSFRGLQERYCRSVGAIGFFYNNVGDEGRKAGRGTKNNGRKEVGVVV